MADEDRTDAEEQAAGQPENEQEPEEKAAAEEKTTSEVEAERASQEPETASEPEAEADQQAGRQAGEVGPEGAPPPDTDVFDMLRAAIGLFAQEAWIALGVQARYGSSETETDLRCARVAIDTTKLLIEQLGDEAEPEEEREFEQLLTNLRLNFVRRRSGADEEEDE